MGINETLKRLERRVEVAELNKPDGKIPVDFGERVGVIRVSPECVGQLVKVYGGDAPTGERKREING